MNQVVVFAEPRRLTIETEDERTLAPHEVLLRTAFSGISAGTELTAYRGSNPYLHKRWDAGRRLFVPGGDTSMSFPVVGFGYEECGQVVDVGSEVTGVQVGDYVYGTWGHRSHHIVSDDYAARRVLPAGIDPILGIFSQIAAIALNGVHDAAIRVGETVAVFGLGTPGQIIAQLARQSGATVIGIDPIPLRRRMAYQLGAIDVEIDPSVQSAAERIKELTEGRGADVCIEASGAYGALHEAIRAAAYSARVVTLGFFQGGGHGLFLGEEFHHNRINLVCSQIFGVAPELTYRWNPDRLVHTAMQLQVRGKLNLEPLITHVYAFAQAAEAFRLCDEEAEKVIQVVLDFNR